MNTSKDETSMPSRGKTKLHTIDGETLMTAPIPQPQFVVAEVLSQGLHLLAGSPKVGKSWLVLWLCLQVSKGEPVWKFPSQQGSVLYLALEDSLARLQRRLLDITDSAPECLHFATLASDIHNGLDEQIRSFLSAYPDTRLVAIDTLQKVRGDMTEQNSYANDYRDLGALKRLADNLGIAILLVHHLRKEYDADPVNRISGTTGISGATDSNFALIREKRGEKKAILYCSGRDIEDRELELVFNSESHMWQLVSDSVEEPEKKIDPVIISLVQYLRTAHSFRGTASELLEVVAIRDGVTPNALSRRIMQNLSVLSENDITYNTHRTGTRREMILTYQCNDANDDDDGNLGNGLVPEISSQPSLSSQATQAGENDSQL